MATNSRGTNQTSILYLHIPFIFEYILQRHAVEDHGTQE